MCNNIGFKIIQYERKCKLMSKDNEVNHCLSSNKKGIFKSIILWSATLVKRCLNHEITSSSGQLAYSLIFCFFPLLIFMLTLIGKSSIDPNSIVIFLQNILPNNSFELIYATVLEVVVNSRTDLLAISGLFSIWSGARGVRVIIKGLNKAYEQKERRHFTTIFILSFLVFISFVFLILFSLFLIVFGEYIGRFIISKLNFPMTFKYMWDWFRYIISLTSLTFIFTAMYHYAPSKKLKFTEVIPGAIFSSVGWVISSQIFAFYVNNFTNYANIYGGLGGIMALLLWLYITSMVILIGGEINGLKNLKKSKRLI